MIKPKLLVLTLAIVAAILLAAHAQDASPSTNAPPIPPRPKKQAAVASTNASFGKIATTNETYKSALDAHALDDALKLVGKDGAFKGTVDRVFEPRGLAIVNFDANYRTAISAVLYSTNYANFPALTNLDGKQVVVTGKFSDYQGRPQIVLSNVDQIKIVDQK